MSKDLDELFRKQFKGDRRVASEEVAAALGFSTVDLINEDNQGVVGSLPKFDGHLYFAPFEKRDLPFLGKYTLGCFFGFYSLENQPAREQADYLPGDTFTPWRNRVQVENPERFFSKKVLAESQVDLLLVIPGVRKSSERNLWQDPGVDPTEWCSELLEYLNLNHRTNLLLQTTEPLAKIPVSQIDYANYSLEGIDNYAFVDLKVFCPGPFASAEESVVHGQASDYHALYRHGMAYVFSVVEILEYKPQLLEGERVFSRRTDGAKKHSKTPKIYHPRLCENSLYPRELLVMDGVVSMQKKNGKGKPLDTWIAPYVSGTERGSAVDAFSVWLRIRSKEEEEKEERPIKIKPEWFDLHRGYQIDAENKYDMRASSEEDGYL